MKRHQVSAFRLVVLSKPPPDAHALTRHAPTRCTPQVMRTTFFFLLLLSLASVATVDAAEAATEEPQATSAAEGGGAAEEAAAEVELPPLDCSNNELLGSVNSWSVDCVAKWLENLGFPELRGAFMGNKVSGKDLKALTMDKLAEDYGVSDADQRKKIYYSLKDAMRKDDSSGNTNHYSMILFSLLAPIFGIYKYMSLTYEKEIEKGMKKYQKWQDKRNPPKPVEPVVYADGTNEWISGLNGDVGGNAGGKKKKDTPKSDKKKKPSKVE